MTEMNKIRAEVVARLQAMLQAVAAGADIPPGQRWRTEGLMEALVLSGACSGDDLQQAMADTHAEVLGQSLEDVLGSAWRQDFPFPEIPYFMQRAPVHRGRSD